MLDKIPTPLSGAICNEKTGWLPPNFDDNCREILTETINELLELQPADFSPSVLASTSRAALQNSQQPENEWEYGVQKIIEIDFKKHSKYIQISLKILIIRLFYFIFRRMMKKATMRRNVNRMWIWNMMMTIKNESAF